MVARFAVCLLRVPRRLLIPLSGIHCAPVGINKNNNNGGSHDDHE